MAALAGAAFASLAPVASASTTWLVCADGACGGYTDIQSAIDAAAWGDTIFVYPGTYAGALTITKSLVLCSIDPALPYWCDPQTADTVIDANGASPYAVFIDSDGVRLEGFTIQNPTYGTVDQDFGAVDPSLVVVYGDNIQIVDNVLQQAAAAPGPGETRWYTVGVNIGTDSDVVDVERNVLRAFPPSKGAGGVCPQAPCGVVGILNWGEGSTFRVVDNVVDLSGVGAPATGIAFDRNGIVHAYDNTITLPGSAPGSAPTVVGIDGGVSSFAQVGGNTIGVGVGETPFGHYGIYGIFTASEFLGNTIRDAQHGIMLRSSVAGDNRVAGNFFLNGNQGLLNYAYATEVENNHFTSLVRGVVLDAVEDVPGASEDVVLFGNEFAQTGRALYLTDTVAGVFVDATHNDWGVYDRSAIENVSVEDASGTNDVDVTCYIDEDGLTAVCPDVSIGQTVLNARWPREIEFVDGTISPREVASREWSFSHDSPATTPTVTRLFVPGSYAVTLTVTDEEGTSGSETITLFLTNTAPTLSAPEHVVATEGAMLTIPLAASDAEGDELVFSMVGAPEGSYLDPATGVFSWLVPYDVDGAWANFIWSANDGAATTTVVTTIEVMDTPIAPYLSAPTSRSVLETRSLAFNVVAYDPDGGAVTLTATGLPPGASFTDNGAGTGSFAWTPAAGAAGTYLVDITATAASTLSTTRTVELRVVQAAGLTFTRVGPATIVASPGETVQLPATIANTGTGSDTYTITATRTTPGWALAPGAPATIAAGASDAVATGVTAPASGGSVSVTVRACSDVDPTLCKTLTWTIRTPLKVTIDLAPTFGPLDVVAGSVKVTWNDGTPVAGASVSLQEQPLLLGTLSSGDTVTTGADGTAAFELAAPTASLPGDHLVFAAATLFANSGAAEDTYEVAL